MKQNLIKQKGKIDISIVISGDFNIPLVAIIRKIGKNSQVDRIGQINCA